MSRTVGRAGSDRGRVSRLVTRALLVLGGTVAATAVGWLISSATASADTLPDLSVPGSHAGPAPVTAGVTNVLDTVGMPAAVPMIPPPPAVAGAIDGAVTQLRSHVPVGRELPVTPLAALSVPPPQVPPPAPGAASQSGPAIGPAARPITAATAVAPIPPGPATVVRSVTHAGTVPVSAVPVFVTPSAPVPSAPWSPVTVPVAPAGSVGTATGGAGPGLADGSGALPVPSLDVVRVLPVTAPPGRATAGKQPGSTPD